MKASLLLLLVQLVVLVVRAQGDPLTEPRTVASANGFLNVTYMDNVLNVVVVPGRPATAARVWNGSFVAPTLRLWPGDTLNLKLVNLIGVPTNIHFHGLHVSPLGHSDNIFVETLAGFAQAYTYTINIPSDHPPGLYWYHSHAMADSEWQVWNGMSGVLVIEGLLDSFPQLADSLLVTERIMCLRDVQLDSNGLIFAAGQTDSGSPTNRLVNGQIAPVLGLHAGSIQFWRIANIGPDIFYNLTLGLAQYYGVSAHVIAIDGNMQTQLTPFPEGFVLLPASRVEILVVASPDAQVGQTFNLTSLAMTTGPAGDSYPETAMVTVDIMPPYYFDDPPALPAASQFPAVPDLRNAAIARTRTFVFSENYYTGYFYIDGQEFSMDSPTNVTATVGDVEEWVIFNTAFEFHVFHIHQGPFQVVSAPSFTGYQDNLLLPMATLASGYEPLLAGSGYGNPDFYNNDANIIASKSVIRVPFTNNNQIGKFVFHCHIMAHEDLGMMSSIQVVPKCPAGPYVDIDGSYQCLQCPANSFSASAGHLGQCDPCGCNMCSNVGSTGCSLCSSLNSSSSSSSSMDQDVRDIKGAMILVVWLLGMIALIPVFLGSGRLASPVVLALNGGIFMSLSLTHMGSYATEFFYTLYDFPVGLVLFGGGFLIMFFLQRGVIGDDEQQQRHQDLLQREQHQLAQLGATKVDAEAPAANDNAEQVTASAIKPTTTTTTTATASSRTALFAAIIFVLILLHEIFDGLVLGVLTTVDNGAATICTAAIGKGIEAFAIGAVLAAVNLPRLASIPLLVLYTLVSPIGIGIGIGIVSLPFSFSFASAIIEGISSGVLFFFALAMLDDAFKSRALFLTKAIVTSLAFGVLCLMEAWSPL